MGDSYFAGEDMTGDIITISVNCRDTKFCCVWVDQEMAERKKIHEEAKALEILKRDEARAEQLQSNAEVRVQHDAMSCDYDNVEK